MAFEIAGLAIFGWVFFSRFVHFHVQLSIAIIVAAGIGSCRYRAAIITIGIIIVVVADGWLISFFLLYSNAPTVTFPNRTKEIDLMKMPSNLLSPRRLFTRETMDNMQKCLKHFNQHQHQHSYKSGHQLQKAEFCRIDWEIWERKFGE